MARLEGFEPPTFSFEGCRSIHLSYRRAELSLLQLLQSEKPLFSFHPISFLSATPLVAPVHAWKEAQVSDHRLPSLLQHAQVVQGDSVNSCVILLRLMDGLAWLAIAFKRTLAYTSLRFDWLT